MKKVLVLTTAFLAASAYAHEHSHKHSSPELNKAMEECHQGLKKKHDHAKVEACLKEKGFEMPADHKKHKHGHKHAHDHKHDHNH